MGFMCVVHGWVFGVEEQTYYLARDDERTTSMHIDNETIRSSSAHHIIMIH